MFSYVVIQLLLWSILFIMIFAFVRVPLMQNGDHFSEMVHETTVDDNGAERVAGVYKPVKGDKAWGLAWYHSIMSQSTLGCGDVQPVTPIARIITAVQAATTLLVFGFVLLMALLFRKSAW